MIYALLAYHDEQRIASMSEERRSDLMAGLLKVHDDIDASSRLGPAARLDFTRAAVTLRPDGKGVVLDGPFAETKEQLLGFYLLEASSQEEAIEAARKLQAVNTTAVYEIRPVTLLVPGQPLSGS